MILICITEVDTRPDGYDAVIRGRPGHGGEDVTGTAGGGGTVAMLSDIPCVYYRSRHLT